MLSTSCLASIQHLLSNYCLQRIVLAAAFLVCLGWIEEMGREGCDHIRELFLNFLQKCQIHLFMICETHYPKQLYYPTTVTIIY